MSEKHNKIKRSLEIDVVSMLQMQRARRVVATGRRARFSATHDLLRGALGNFCKIASLDDRDFGGVDVFSHGGLHFVRL